MISQIRPSELSAWLETARAHGEPVVLDVREPLELRTASVRPDGFTLLTIPMGALQARLDELDPAQPIAVPPWSYGAVVFPAAGARGCA